ELRGVLALCSPEPLRREQVDSLEALATQVSLGVEGAVLAEDLHRRQSEARFRSLVAHSSDLITVLDADGVVTYQSPSIERVLGYRADEVEGTRFDRLVGEADRPRLAQVVADVGRERMETHVIECTLQHRDGTWLQFEVQHTDLLRDEHVHGIVLNSRNVSERKAFEEQLAHQAFHDPVTNLANRALFADRVQQALMRAQRASTTVGVMFIDLADGEVPAPDAEELLRNADVAMYMAKRDSKGSYRVFEPAMHERVLERLELRAELQRAVDENELEVHYQPVVRLDGQMMYGVEA